MSDDRDARIRAALVEMRGEYLRELPGKIARLGALLARAPDDADAFREARMEAHRIFGTSGSLGLEEVSAAAGRMERAMMSISGELAGSAGDWSAVHAALREMEAHQGG